MRWLLAVFCLWPLAACETLDWGAALDWRETRHVTFLMMNDVYRIERLEGGQVGGLARFAALRSELADDGNLIAVLAGDFLYPSLLSRQYDGEQIIDILNRLDGDPAAFDNRFFVTFGNHEFDKSALRYAGLVDERIELSQFTWLASNIAFAKGQDGEPLIKAANLWPDALVELDGVTVGLLGLTTDIKKPEYILAFGDPIESARAQTKALRAAGADLVVAITHLSVPEDRRLLEALGDDGPDLILGGHEHTRQLLDVEGRVIVKADADLKSAAIVTVTLPKEGPKEIEVAYRDLAGASPEPDPMVAMRVSHWLARHDAEFCAASYQMPPGCLDEPLGLTQVELVAEELEIRKYETNLGNWVLDQALAALKYRGAQIAFLNAGSLRLNQNIPAGTEVTRRHLDELFAYPNELRLIEIDGATLQKVIERAAQNWEGNGWWLQIAGFAFRFDPASGKVGDLTLLTPQGPKAIAPSDRLLAVTNDFLMEPKFGQDGYTMLRPEMIRPLDPAPPSLRDLVIAALQKAGPEGIAPALEGRICNSERPGPCLAIGP